MIDHDDPKSDLSASENSYFCSLFDWSRRAIDCGLEAMRFLQLDGYHTSASLKQQSESTSAAEIEPSNAATAANTVAAADIVSSSSTSTIGKLNMAGNSANYSSFDTAFELFELKFDKYLRSRKRLSDTAPKMRREDDDKAWEQIELLKDGISSLHRRSNEIWSFTDQTMRFLQVNSRVDNHLSSRRRSIARFRQLSNMQLAVNESAASEGFDDNGRFDCEPFFERLESCGIRPPNYRRRRPSQIIRSLFQLKTILSVAFLGTAIYTTYFRFAYPLKFAEHLESVKESVFTFFVRRVYEPVKAVLEDVLFNRKKSLTDTVQSCC